MTTHYDALVRDAADAARISDAYAIRNDWSDMAVQAGRRAWILRLLAKHSFGGREPGFIEEHWDSKADVMKGLVGQSVFIDAVRVQFKALPSVVVVRYRIRHIEDEATTISPGEDTAAWSQAVMTPASFQAFLGEFFLEDRDV